MSNKCKEFFPNNKTSSFSTKLRTPISLNNESWEVGVSSFIYQQAINNFGGSLLMEMMVYDGNHIHTISFPDVHVSTSEDVVAHLEAALKRYSEENNFRVVSMIVDQVKNSPSSDDQVLTVDDEPTESRSRKRKRDVPDSISSDSQESEIVTTAETDENDEKKVKKMSVKKMKTENSLLDVDSLIESYMSELLAAILTIEHIGFSTSWDRLYHLIYCVKINTSIQLSWTKVSRFIGAYFPDQFNTLNAFFIYRFIQEQYSNNTDYLSIVDIAGAIFNYATYLSDLLANRMIVDDATLISVTGDLEKRVLHHFKNGDHEKSELVLNARTRSKEIMSHRAKLSNDILDIVPKHFARVMNNDTQLTNFVIIMRELKMWIDQTITILNEWKKEQNAEFFSILFALVEVSYWLESYKIRIRVGEQANSPFLLKFSSINTKVEQLSMVGDNKKTKRRLPTARTEQYKMMKNDVVARADELIKNISTSGADVDKRITDKILASVREDTQSDSKKLDVHEEHWRLMILKGARIHFVRGAIDSFNMILHQLERDPYWKGYDAQMVRELIMNEDLSPEEVLQELNKSGVVERQNKIREKEEQEKKQHEERTKQIELLKTQLTEEREKGLRQLQALMDKIAKLSADKTKQEEEESKLLAHIAEKEQELQKKAQEIQNLKKRNQDAIEELLKENETSEKRKKNLEENKKKAGKEVTRLQTENLDLAQQLSGMKNRIKFLKEQLEFDRSTLAQLSETKFQVETSEAEKVALTRKIQETETLLNKQEEVKTRLNEQLENVKTQIKTTEGLVVSLTSQLTTYDQQIESLSQQREHKKRVLEQQKDALKEIQTSIDELVIQERNMMTRGSTTIQRQYDTSVKQVSQADSPIINQFRLANELVETLEYYDTDRAEKFSIKRFYTEGQDFENYLEQLKTDPSKITSPTSIKIIQDVLKLIATTRQPGGSKKELFLLPSMYGKNFKRKTVAKFFLNADMINFKLIDGKLEIHLLENFMDIAFSPALCKLVGVGDIDNSPLSYNNFYRRMMMREYLGIRKNSLLHTTFHDDILKTIKKQSPETYFGPKNAELRETDYFASLKLKNANLAFHIADDAIRMKKSVKKVLSQLFPLPVFHYMVTRIFKEGKIPLSDALIYGFFEQTINRTIRCPEQIDLNSSSLIFLYTNLIKPDYVNNDKNRLLEIIPVRSVSDAKIDLVEFSNTHYKTVEVRVLNDIHFYIATAQGTPVPFRYGPATIQLHFRRRR